MCHHENTRSVREWKSGHLPWDVPGYLRFTSGKDAKSFAPPLSTALLEACSDLSEPKSMTVTFPETGFPEECLQTDNHPSSCTWQ